MIHPVRLPHPNRLKNCSISFPEANPAPITEPIIKKLYDQKDAGFLFFKFTATPFHQHTLCTVLKYLAACFCNTKYC